MKEKILDFIKKNQLFSPGDRVIAGFSGGADSTALLLILKELEGELGLDVSALHVHHGIRKETADRDEAFCREFCKARQIPFMSCHVETLPYAKKNGLSEEEAARILRYRCFREKAEECGANKAALAHHKNDQAETVLFNLVRGSYLKGLSGMPVKREDEAFPGLVYVRPMLEVSREEILEYLKSWEAEWCEDETNALEDYSRNRIRQSVIPALESVRPDAVERIVKTAGYLESVDAYLRREANAWINAHEILRDGAEEAGMPEEYILSGSGENTGNAGKNRITVDKRAFSALDQVLKTTVLSEMIRRMGAGSRDIAFVHLKDAAGLADKPAGKRLSLPGGLTVLTSYTGLSVAPGDPGLYKNNSPVHMICTEKKRDGSEEIPDFPYTKWFDCGKINGPAVLRAPEEGDRIAVLPGTKKRLNRFFIDEKVPKELRGSVPVVASGHDILWVVGYRMSEDYKITESTERILEIRIVFS